MVWPGSLTSTLLKKRARKRVLGAKPGWSAAIFLQAKSLTKKLRKSYMTLMGYHESRKTRGPETPFLFERKAVPKERVAGIQISAGPLFV